MGKFKAYITRLMYGRYGIDQLYYAMIAVCFALLIANMFINSTILGLLIWPILILTMYRSFSKNSYKRRMENEKFLKVWNRIIASYKLSLRRIKEIKTHRFRKCPHCKKTLRLPRKVGKHTVKCPICHQEFEVRVIL